MLVDFTLSAAAPCRFRSILRGPRDPGRRLVRQVLDLAGGQARLLRHSERMWFSATFWGRRHRLTLEFAGLPATDDGETFITVLPDHEFAIRDWLVATASIIAVSHELAPAPRMIVEAELLLLEET